jgi:hypothetical protein
MDETTELEIVDLGEARELTKGVITPPLPEDNPIARYQPLS